MFKTSGGNTPQLQDEESQAYPPLRDSKRTRANLSLDLNSYKQPTDNDGNKQDLLLSSLHKELEEFNLFRKDEKKTKIKTKSLLREKLGLEKALAESQLEMKNLQHKYFDVEKELLSVKKQNIKLGGSNNDPKPQLKQNKDHCVISSVRKILNAPRNQDIIARVQALKLQAEKGKRERELIAKIKGLVCQLSGYKPEDLSVKMIWKWIRFLAEDYAKIKQNK